MKMARRASARPSDVVGLAAARDSLHRIRRVSEDSLFGLYEIDPEKAFRLSYLREQFRFNRDLGVLFDRYTERINQAYFSLFLMLQAGLMLLHFILVLVLNANKHTLSSVILDLIFYATICVLSLCVLVFNEIRAKTRSYALRFTSFLVFAMIFTVDLFIPIYYCFSLEAHNLRPAYTVHVLLASYLFCNVSSHLFAILLGIFTTTCHLATLGVIRYRNGDMTSWSMGFHYLGSDLVFLVCLNCLGVYFRYTNELVKRRTFLDHRACVESTLRLKDEKEQEEQLMLSIIPEHTVNEVRRDILDKIEMLEKMFEIPPSDPMEVPYVHEFDNVTILYADIVNYTVMTTKLDIVTLVETLNDLFGGFDDASEKLKVLRIKFLGDCYYCVSGLPPNPAPNHAEACIDLGLKMIAIIKSVREKRDLMVDMRIGVHSGKIWSGIIGSTKWQFDVWSKDVSLANKMESSGEPGKVHITEQTRQLTKKPYKITPTNKGETEKDLVPYHVKTFLISPSEEETPTVTFSRTVEKKKLAKILGSEVENGPTFPERHLNGSAQSVLIRSTSASNIENRDVPDSSHMYARRDSLYPQTGIMRRISGHPALNNNPRISSRRNTPRRTAFMDINLNRYNKRLRMTDENIKEAIDNMPLTKYQQWIKMKDINPLLLTFRNYQMEWDFVKLLDPLFKYYLVAYIVLFLAMIAIQNIVSPQRDRYQWFHYSTLILMFGLLIPLTCMYSVWNRYVARNRPDNDLAPYNKFGFFFYRVSQIITQNVTVRTIIYLTVCGFFLASVVQELFQCQSVTTNKSNMVVLLTVLLRQGDLSNQCILPWHMTYTFSLAILASFCFLRIHIALKLVFALAVTIFYSATVWNFNSDFYKDSETFNNNMPPQIAHIVSLVFLTITLHVIDRQNEYLNRLDFQWNQKLVSEKMEVNVMRKITKMLLKNILPMHIVTLYLDMTRTTNELYSKKYSNVAVIFATVVDYPTDLSEKAFLGFMNRVIKDFDTLLLSQRRNPIEKIKVNNLTYMAACGLERNEISEMNGNLDRSGEDVAVTLVKFAVDMVKTLDRMNREMQQTCTLRIGIDSGHIMAGVVGTKKPFYDIWGDTVNVASRMDSTGEAGRIQITESTAKILQAFGVACEYRGIRPVKGKGDIPTYFVSLNEENDLIYASSNL